MGLAPRDADARPPATRAELSSFAAQLRAEVDKIAESHRAELNAFVERSMLAMREPRLLGAPRESGQTGLRSCVWTEEPPPAPPTLAPKTAPPTFAPKTLQGVDSEDFEMLRHPSEVPEVEGRRSVQSMASTPASERPMRRRVSIRRKKNSVAKDLLPKSDAPTLPRTWLERITTSRYWEFGSGALIILNAFFIGCQTQILASSAETAVAEGRPFETSSPSGFLALQVVFTVLFSFELGFRWFCEGLVGFFMDDDKLWNALDVGVVSFSILDLFLSVIVDTTDVLGNLSVLRVLRVVRIVRVARVIRIMKFFRELRMMIYSILRSMKSLLWVILVLSLTFYLFGITFTHGTILTLDTPARWSDPDTAGLRTNFGTLDRSMLALFMAMSGGNDWATYYDALRPLPWPYRAFFLIYISFALFAVVNIVTGVFVDSAMQSNSEDKVITAHEELESKKDYLRAMREIFNEMDQDGTGSISLTEFEEKLADERVIAYFSAMKLDVSDAQTLFFLLDHDRSGEVDIHEFVSGCYKLQGESRSLDVKLMQYELNFVREGVSKISESVVGIQKCVRALQSSKS